jgi:hypothetical protein
LRRRKHHPLPTSPIKGEGSRETGHARTKFIAPTASLLYSTLVLRRARGLIEQHPALLVGRRC